MDGKLKSLVSQVFTEFNETNGFELKISSEKGFIEFESELFTVKLERYRDELYVYLYKYGSDEINLFNLVNYLHQGTLSEVRSNYFRREEYIESRWKSQARYIVEVLNKNFEEIRKFYRARDYHQLVKDVEAFVVRSNPDLFQKG